MKHFSFILTILGVLETISTLIPQTHGESDVTPREDFHRRSSRVMNRNYGTNNTEHTSTKITHAVDAEYNDDAAGAVLVSSGCKYITGTFTVPSPGNVTLPTAAAIGIWIGLDGYTSEDSILQTGLEIDYGDGEVSFEAWYEWYPNYAYDFSGFEVDSGNTIRLTLTATSTTSGTALVENLTTGQSVSHTFTGEEALEEVNAEWIVQLYDAESLGGITGITFEDASAACGKPSSATKIVPSWATVTTTSNSVIIKVT
ncbi:Aspergillopepsin-2 [Cytospora mali]|uniref:Aspergillopepsin-2 n=1 Tax=Cytospora mali TaxID=578113 RepID=A0A194VP69_CYTMA|nr:Aspergillopepsin-2 [Valsa mali]